MTIIVKIPVDINNLLYNYQLVFENRNSTHLAIIVLLDRILEAFLDLSKAFIDAFS